MLNRYALSATALLITTSLLALQGCSDDPANDQPSTTGSSAGGQGPVGPTGSGGSGDAVGSGGSGGGSSAVQCLDSSEHETFFSLELQTLCLVATYTAPFAQGYAVVPSWGRHGGPLTASQGTNPADSITIHRWSVPSSSFGALSASAEGPTPLSISTSPLFLNASVIDVPINNWTLVGWDEFGTTSGEVIALDANTVDNRFNANGFFSAIGLPSNENNGRLVYTSMTALNNATASPEAAVYFADFCNGSLCGVGQLAASGDASGVVSADSAGNVFAVLPDVTNGDQDVYAFASSTVGFQANNASGDLLATLDGSGTALAALAPTDDGLGYLFFQALDTSYAYTDPVVFSYRENGNEITLEDAATTAITMKTANTQANMMSDSAGRLWLAVDSGVEQTSFFVLARKPLQ